MAFLFQYRSGSGGGGVTTNIYTADGTTTDAVRAVSISGTLSFLLQTGGVFSLESDGTFDEFYFETNLFTDDSCYIDIYADGSADPYTQLVADRSGTNSNIYGSPNECFISNSAPGELSKISTLVNSEIALTVGNPDQLNMKMGSTIGADGAKAGFFGYFPDFPVFNYTPDEFGFFIDEIDDGGPVRTVYMQSGSAYIYTQGNISQAFVTDGTFSCNWTLSGIGQTVLIVGQDDQTGIGDWSRSDIIITPTDLANQMMLRSTTYDSAGLQKAASQVYSSFVDPIQYIVFNLSDSTSVVQSMSMSSDGVLVMDGLNTGGDFAIVGYENGAINVNAAIDIQAVNNINLGCDNITFGLGASDLVQFQAEKILFDGGSVFVMAGNGTPEGVVTANVGSLFLRQNGGAGTTLYVKESGAGNTGWVAK